MVKYGSDSCGSLVSWWFVESTKDGRIGKCTFQLYRNTEDAKADIGKLFEVTIKFDRPGILYGRENDDLDELDKTVLKYGRKRVCELINGRNWQPGKRYEYRFPERGGSLGLPKVGRQDPTDRTATEDTAPDRVQ